MCYAIGRCVIKTQIFVNFHPTTRVTARESQAKKFDIESKDSGIDFTLWRKEKVLKEQNCRKLHSKFSKWYKNSRFTFGNFCIPRISTRTFNFDLSLPTSFDLLAKQQF